MIDELKIQFVFFILGLSVSGILYFYGYTDMGVTGTYITGIVFILWAGMTFYVETVLKKNIYFGKAGIGINRYDIVYLGRNVEGRPYILSLIKGEKCGNEGLYSKYTKALHEKPNFILEQHNGSPLAFYYVIGKEQALPVDLITHIEAKTGVGKDGMKISKEELRALFPLFDIDSYKDLVDERVQEEKNNRIESEAAAGKKGGDIVGQVIGAGLIVGAALIIAIVTLNYSNDQYNKARAEGLSIVTKNIDMAGALYNCNDALAVQVGAKAPWNSTVNRTAPSTASENALNQVADVLTGG